MSEQSILFDYLNDILESTTDIKKFTAGMTSFLALEGRGLVRGRLYLGKMVDSLGKNREKIPGELLEVGQYLLHSLCPLRHILPSLPLHPYSHKVPSPAI